MSEGSSAPTHIMLFKFSFEKREAQLGRLGGTVESFKLQSLAYDARKRRREKDEPSSTRPKFMGGTIFAMLSLM